MSPEDGEVAAALIERRDPRVMAAYDVYFEDQDVHELVDTIEKTVSTVRKAALSANHVVLAEDTDQQVTSSEGTSTVQGVEDSEDGNLVDGDEPIEILQRLVAAAYNTGNIQYETALELMKPSSMADQDSVRR